MKRKGLYYSIIIVVALSLVFVTVRYQKPQQNNIKIGAILPLTGDIASYGKSAQNGIELALGQLKIDSLNKIKIEIEFQDSKGDKETAVGIMQKFATSDKYPVVIGEAASSITKAMIPIATSNKTLQISPISSSPDLTDNDYFFRVCPSDAFQASISAKWMFEDGAKNVGILYVNNAWGISLMELFKSNYKSRGGEIKDVEASNEGDKDFRTQIVKLLNSGINAIYCPTYGKEGGLILKQLKELGNKFPVYGADVWSSPELLATAKNAAEGIKIVKPSELSSNSYNSFKSEYQAKYKIAPDVYAAYSYDLLMILNQAFNSGAISGEQVKSFLLNMKVYYGVTGPTKFDSNGDCNTKPFIKQIIKDGIYTSAN